jgi:bifunctional non-homologous end joining protein LigD
MKASLPVTQNTMEHGDASLIFFAFDLLFLDGEDIRNLPLVDRKTRLEAFLVAAPAGLRYHDHQIDHGPLFHRLACEHDLEGIVSKRVNGRYEPDRRSWLKTKCLNREEFVVVGWSGVIGALGNRTFLGAQTEADRNKAARRDRLAGGRRRSRV